MSPVEDSQEGGAFDYDLFVLGAGSGGVRASRMAAASGARVAVAESGPLGGTCVNVGCVPKKLFVYASHLRQEVEDAKGFGWSVDGLTFDWPTLRDNKTREIERLNGIYQRLLDDAGVEVIRGRARLLDRHTVQVTASDGTVSTHTARYLLIGVGGKPNLPATPGVEHSVSSNEMFYLDELPERAVVAGGGYIAVEFAGILHGLGVETTLIYRRDLFLRGFDDDVRTGLRDEMQRQGIRLVFDQVIDRIDREGDDGPMTLQFSAGERVETDLLLYAIGRSPNTSDLGLEEVGIETNASGAIQVDLQGRTSVDNVFAIGDVTDRVNLTPVAIHEAMCLVRTLFHDDPTTFDHETITTAVFSQPPIGTVGLTETEARQRLGDGRVEVYRSTFRPMKYTLSDNQERTMMKLVVDKRDRRVLGAHMLGVDAGEILQGIGIAVKMGATKEDFDRTIGIHPTSAEEFVTMRDPVG